MKKALKMLLAYLAWLVAGTLIGTFFYSLYLHSLSLVAGRASPVLSRENLAVSLFIVSQIFAFLSGFLIIAYRIRHPGSALQLVAFIITQCLSFGLLFPLSYHFENKYIMSHKYILFQEDVSLSSGFFRETPDGNVYYFLDDTNANSIVIDTSENGISKHVPNNMSGYIDLTQNSAPYKDILIRNSFTTKSSDYSFFGTLQAVAQRDLDRGWTFWLGFLSMALALSSIYAFVGQTAWRLANYSLCGILYGAILFLNGFFWTPAMKDFRNMSFLHCKPFEFLSEWLSSPFIVCINLLFALIVSIIGLINYIIKKKRGR